MGERAMDSKRIATGPHGSRLDFPTTDVKCEGAHQLCGAWIPQSCRGVTDPEPGLCRVVAITPIATGVATSLLDLFMGFDRPVTMAVLAR